MNRTDTTQREQGQSKQAAREMTAAEGYLESCIICALEPFDNDRSRIEPLKRVLHAWNRVSRKTVLPVSVIAPTDLHWPFELVVPLRDQLFQIANQSLLPMIEALDFEDVAQPRLLIQDRSSTRDAALTLIDAALKHHAELIAVNTHGRRGFNRLRLGSFAEALISASPVPVLTINPKTIVSPEFKRILFPTDFSPASRRAFKTVLSWAKKFNAQVVLYHKIEMPVSPYVYGDGTIVIDTNVIDLLIQDAETARQRRASYWIAAARNRGVECEALLSRDSGNTAETIAKAAENEKTDLIAMNAYSASFGQRLLGGTAREVLSVASRPVLVLHAR